MKGLVKIDKLFVFLLLSVLCLLLISPDILSRLLSVEATVIKQFQPIEKIVHFPREFIADENDSIYAYDPDYDLEYSVDGGDHFVKFTVLRASDIRQNNITNRNFSIRSKPVKGEQPTVNSILIRGKHKKKPIFLKVKQLTFNDRFNHNLPILSLVVSEDNLVSDFNGILVMGLDSWFDGGFKKPFWERNANYKRRGEQSKKKVWIQYIVNKKVELESVCSIQVSGNATRSFPQKSFKLKANRAYGTETFNYKFFKKGLKKYRSLVVRNSGNDNTKTLFADLMMQTLSKKSKALVQKGKAVVVYLNGNYWGIYNLRERVDTYFIAEAEDKKMEEITILEGGDGVLKDGDEAIRSEFVNLINGLKEVEVLNHIQYEKIKGQVSLKSFMDYIIVESFFANSDWLSNNTIWYKAGNKRWKWVLQDLDYGLAYLGSQQVNANLFQKLERSGSLTAELYRKLMTNTTFKARFKERALKKVEKWFNEDKVKQTYEDLKFKIEPEILNHTKRWRGNFTVGTWEENCKKNYNFILNRKHIYFKQIKELN